MGCEFGNKSSKVWACSRVLEEGYYFYFFLLLQNSGEMMAEEISLCECKKRKPCKVFTAWTDLNPNCRFYRCELFRVSLCFNFFRI